MAGLHQITSYLAYWLNAVDQHSLQPPFIYDLYTAVFQQKEKDSQFEAIEGIRSQLKASAEYIEIEDYGAGSQVAKQNQRQISDIAGKGITKRKYSRLLYRLARYINATHIVELGTSLGINTLYLAHDSGTRVATLEGSQSLAHIAQDIFDRMHQTNIHLIQGNIDQTLDSYMRYSSNIDLAFIDANHRYEPTIRYFNLLKEKAHKGSCFIFDDIHWSAEMENVWEEIKNHHHVTLSIDIYQMGLIFFKPELRKQHYILQF